MVKSIVVLLNLIGLIIFELFYGETVTVKQDVPNTIEINVGDTVQVSIKKEIYLVLQNFSKICPLDLI